jgi:hypothetical protein
MGGMMRIGSLAIFFVLAGALSLPVGKASAQSAPSVVRLAQVAPQEAPPPRRPRTRLRVYPYYEPGDVYPHYFPGSNAVRVCNATYVQEYRLSGTVIVPHMICHWRGG